MERKSTYSESLGYSLRFKDCNMSNVSAEIFACYPWPAVLSINLVYRKRKADGKDKAKETASRLKSGDSLLVSPEHVDAQEFPLL